LGADALEKSKGCISALIKQGNKQEAIKWVILDLTEAVEATPFQRTIFAQLGKLKPHGDWFWMPISENPKWRNRRAKDMTNFNTNSTGGQCVRCQMCRFGVQVDL